jgi:hypothetical protein
MGRFVTDDVNEAIARVMFSGFGDTPKENFLKTELMRYVPELMKEPEEKIHEFVNYQRGIYLEGKLPIIGKPIASLNPTFVDSVVGIKVKDKGLDIYTRASLKENGYRMQLHIGEEKNSAFTRQFTPYELRIFPELTETLKKLPVMIGDAELINKRHKHLAGFNRVDVRLPGTKFWPRKGTEGLSKELIQEYFAREDLFSGGKIFDEFELTLAFHGIIAIAHPSTWHESRKVQAQRLISLCDLPINYERMDEVLKRLAFFIREHNLNARIVEMRRITALQQLKKYIEEKEIENVEGVCVVQSAWDEKYQPVVIGRSMKIKKYETIDMVLMGIYLKKAGDGLTEDNITGGLLGLYDYALGEFLPALKVNFDPEGRQIKTDGQRERLTKLRRELVETLSGKKQTRDLPTLHQTFFAQGKITLKYMCEGNVPENLEAFFAEIPRGHDVIDLFELYLAGIDATKPKSKMRAYEIFILKFQNIFQMIAELGEERRKYLLRYFSKEKDIKNVSKKLVKPQIILDLAEPVILEAQVFHIKWGTCPYPAGFHTKYADSFFLENAFAERIRNDKKTTTEYQEIYKIARLNTVRNGKKK